MNELLNDKGVYRTTPAILQVELKKSRIREAKHLSTNADAEKTVKRYLKSEQTDGHTVRRTDRRLLLEAHRLLVLLEE